MDDAKQEAGDKTSAGEMKSQADQVLEELGIPIAGEYIDSELNVNELSSHVISA